MKPSKKSGKFFKEAINGRWGGVVGISAGHQFRRMEKYRQYVSPTHLMQFSSSL